MYGSCDEVYIEAMTEDIALAARMLALGVETEVPECGLFEPLKVPFRDKSGRLDITDWWLRVFSLGSLVGCDKTENRRCLELVGALPGGYKISSCHFCGTKEECLAALRHPDYAERVKDSIRHDLFWMDD